MDLSCPGFGVNLGRLSYVVSAGNKNFDGTMRRHRLVYMLLQLSETKRLKISCESIRLHTKTE